MKKTLLIAAALVLLAGAPVLIRAGDANSPTNSPGNSTGAAVKPYPLDYCLVSGDKIGGDMGKPVVIVHQGQQIKFCCSDCPPKFEKNPEKYMKMLGEAQKAAGPDKK
jgi:hypothetical protein